MPIKLCQKCGLKVYVEEGRPAPNPFLCTRCQAVQRAAMKQVSPFDQTAIMSQRPQPAEAPPIAVAAAPVAEATQKSRLACPACGGVFSAKLPERPSRGKCPRCLRVVTVHPDGKVRLGGETTVRPKPAEAAAGPPSEATAVEEAIPPPAEPAPVEPAPVEAGVPETSPEDAPPPEEAPPPEDAPPPEAPPADEAAPVEEAPPPEEAPAAETRPRRPGMGAARLRAGTRRLAKPESAEAAGAEAGAPAGDGTGKIAFTVICVLLPVGLAAGLLFKEATSGVADLLAKAGEPYRRTLAQWGGVKVAPSADEKSAVPSSQGAPEAAPGSATGAPPAPPPAPGGAEGAPPAPTPVPPSPAPAGPEGTPPASSSATTTVIAPLPAPAPSGAEAPSPVPPEAPAPPAPPPEAAAPQPVTERFDVADILPKYEGDHAKLVADLKQAVGPFDDSFDGNQLVVTAAPDVVAKVKAFLEQKKSP